MKTLEKVIVDYAAEVLRLMSGADEKQVKECERMLAQVSVALIAIGNEEKL